MLLDDRKLPENFTATVPIPPHCELCGIPTARFSIPIPCESCGRRAYLASVPEDNIESQLQVVTDGDGTHPINKTCPHCGGCPFCGWSPGHSW